MKQIVLKNATSNRYSHPRRKLGETPVKAGLSYTPSQMAKMAEQGIPISNVGAQVLAGQEQYNDTWDIPLNDIRRVDMADVWNVQQSARRKIAAAHRDDRKKYGD